LAFLANLSRLDINWTAVAGLAAGGMLLAPVAAKLVAWLPKRQLGIFVGIAIILINAIRLIGN
jgi:uncharacterized membrane protein YfcA